jgi:hypothetical protein
LVNTDAGAGLCRTTTPDVAANAKMKARGSAEIMMWVWTIGAFYLAAVVNQIAITPCRRAQAAEPGSHESRTTPR